jgi:hypothetical protein
MHPRGELISEKPSGRGCYVRELAPIIGPPITRAPTRFTSNTAIIRRMVRHDVMCRAIAAAYEVDDPQLNDTQLTEPKAQTITNGMLQKVRLCLATLASSAEDP